MKQQPIQISILAVTVAAIVFVLDPIGWWTFDYDEDDMRAAVEGRWKLAIERSGERQELELTIRQGGVSDLASRDWVRAATACSDRSLVRSASACIDSSTMPLEITVLGPNAPTAYGRFMVHGTSFGRGYLQIDIGDRVAPIASVGAKVLPTGVVESVESHHGTATLARVSSVTAQR